MGERMRRGHSCAQRSAQARSRVRVLRVSIKIYYVAVSSALGMKNILYSSVGQSVRLLTARSTVRSRMEKNQNYYIFLFGCFGVLIVGCCTTYFFHLALHFCSCDGRERTAGPGRRFDHHSAQGLSLVYSGCLERYARSREAITRGRKGGRKAQLGHCWSWSAI
jgi:hypothetical protein